MIKYYRGYRIICNISHTVVKTVKIIFNGFLKYTFSFALTASRILYLDMMFFMGRVGE